MISSVRSATSPATISQSSGEDGTAIRRLFVAEVTGVQVDRPQRRLGADGPRP